MVRMITSWNMPPSMIGKAWLAISPPWPRSSRPSARFSRTWAAWQAKSSRQNLSELAIELVPEALKASFAADVERYKKEKEAIKVEAEKFEAASKAADERSAEQLDQHLRWAQATTLMQISIALAAIALLTKRRWMVNMMFGVIAVGVLVGIAAWLHY